VIDKLCLLRPNSGGWNVSIGILSVGYAAALSSMADPEGSG